MRSWKRVETQPRCRSGCWRGPRGDHRRIPGAAALSHGGSPRVSRPGAVTWGQEGRAVCRGPVSRRCGPVAPGRCRRPLPGGWFGSSRRVPRGGAFRPHRRLCSRAARIPGHPGTSQCIPVHLTASQCIPGPSASRILVHPGSQCMPLHPASSQYILVHPGSQCIPVHPRFWYISVHPGSQCIPVHPGSQCNPYSSTSQCIPDPSAFQIPVHPGASWILVHPGSQCIPVQPRSR